MVLSSLYLMTQIVPLSLSWKNLDGRTKWFVFSRDLLNSCAHIPFLKRLTLSSWLTTWVSYGSIKIETLILSIGGTKKLCSLILMSVFFNLFDETNNMNLELDLEKDSEYINYCLKKSTNEWMIFLKLWTYNWEIFQIIIVYFL